MLVNVPWNGSVGFWQMTAERLNENWKSWMQRWRLFFYDSDTFTFNQHLFLFSKACYNGNRKRKGWIG